MPATLEIRSAHGGTNGSPASQSAVTSIRFKAADNDTADTNNPLVKPTSGTNYSYEKWLKLQVTVAPDNSLTNLRFHRSSGTPSTGITDLYGEVSQASGYVVPVGTASSVATTSMPTSATVLTNNNGTQTTTGQYGPWIVIQWQISTSASAGTQNTLTYRFTYDEA